jgi:RimJ/RimL family protein N-acetyltransferase
MSQASLHHPLGAVAYSAPVPPTSPPHTGSPSSLELVTLRDGSRLSLRAAAAVDEPALLAFLGALCLEARRLRFFSAAIDVDKAAHWAAATGAGRYGLIAEDDDGSIVGHAAYVELDHTRAEVAVEIADDLHGQGLGTILIERLACAAERFGVARFEALVLPENRLMLEVFTEGFDARVRFRDGTDTVEFPTSASRLAHERFPDGTRAPGVS